MNIFFEPFDGATFSDIESEIRESVGQFIPWFVNNKYINNTCNWWYRWAKGSLYINSEGQREF